METVLDLVREYGVLSYALLFAYCASKSGALPLFAGYAAQAGALEVGVVAAAVFAGGYLGDEIRFHLVRRYGIGAIEARPRFARALATARGLLERYGVAYMFLYRYPKGMRTIGALPVGLTDIPWLRFTALNACSAGLWTVLLVGAGYLFGATIEQAVASGWGAWSVALLAMFLLGFFFAWRRVSRVASATTP
ncbi:MAG: VTT domain-containing protein [Alphaproteobacteria bacterium]|nr:VTT domain-containing protein [Alphaproteobacteria bacterium]